MSHLTVSFASWRIRSSFDVSATHAFTDISLPLPLFLSAVVHHGEHSVLGAQRTITKPNHVCLVCFVCCLHDCPRSGKYTDTAQNDIPGAGREYILGTRVAGQTISFRSPFLAAPTTMSAWVVLGASAGTEVVLGVTHPLLQLGDQINYTRYVHNARIYRHFRSLLCWQRIGFSP